MHYEVPSGEIIVNNLYRVLEGCESVLDIGCGPGKYLNVLDVPRRVGLDAFPGELDKVNWPTVCATAQEYLPTLADNSFDAIIMLDVIEHMVKDEAIEVINQALRVAAHMVVVFTPRGFCPQKKDVTGLGNDHQIHLSGWTAQELRDLGFVVEEWAEFNYGNDYKGGGLWACAIP